MDPRRHSRSAAMAALLVSVGAVVIAQWQTADYYFHADDLHNVMAVTDSGGNAVERYEYEDYGRPQFMNAGGSSLAATGVGNALLFTGRRYDSETGRYDYRTRSLDPIAGRFTSRDSIGIWGARDGEGNAFVYVTNNPATHIDPLGREGSRTADGGRSADSSTEWEVKNGSSVHTAKIGQCCYKITLTFTWRQRFVTRNGTRMKEWKDLKYTGYTLGAKVKCTGQEVGELGGKDLWLDWHSPYSLSGQVEAPLSGQLTPDPFSQAPAAGGEAPASANPQMLGD